MEDKKITTKSKKKIVPETEVIENKAEEETIKEETIDEETIDGEDKETLDKKSKKYIEATGRRKTAVARVRIWTRGEKELLVNNKPYEKYFTTFELQEVLTAALKKMKCFDKFKVSIIVKGGGLSAQAEAARHAITRALVKFNPDFRKRLKKSGYLTRDSRMRERKKFGLKRARRAPQWTKR